MAEIIWKKYDESLEAETEVSIKATFIIKPHGDKFLVECLIAGRHFMIFADDLESAKKKALDFSWVGL